MDWNTYTWPLQEAWASCKNSEWILKASAERKGEREEGGGREGERERKRKTMEKLYPFYDLVPEVTQPHSAFFTELGSCQVQTPREGTLTPLLRGRQVNQVL